MLWVEVEGPASSDIVKDIDFQTLQLIFKALSVLDQNTVYALLIDGGPSRLWV